MAPVLLHADQVVTIDAALDLIGTDRYAADDSAVEGTGGNRQYNLFHAVQVGDVDLTMVGRRVVVEDWRLLSGALEGLIADAGRAVPGLFARRADWLARQAVAHGLRPD